MVVRKPVIGAVLAVAFAYGIYPYVTLYRLGQAVRNGDAASLESMVNWDAVREGIKEDICDLVIDQPEAAKTGDQLPPFGAGFVRGIATNAVDSRITPQALVAATQQPAATTAPQGAAVQISWAFFAGPAAFMVDLSAPGQDTPIRLQMDLRDGCWRVTRVWLPPDLLGQNPERT